jgi:hypothetical protein
MSREDADLPDGLRERVLGAAAQHNTPADNNPGITNMVRELVSSVGCCVHGVAVLVNGERLCLLQSMRLCA